jgi:multiple antibiotic resistance protein
VVEHFLLAFPAVFLIVDPFGALPVFLAMTTRDSVDKSRAMARKACLAAAVLMAAFAVFGGMFFQVFGLTLSAFRVAGGLLLMLTALDMLRAQRPQTRTSESEEKEGEEKDDIAIVPLAMPVLAGPGSIATVMVLVSPGGGYERTTAVLASIVLTFVIAYLVLRSAQPVKRVLGATGLALVNRLFGLVLATIAVQFILGGARDVLAGK